MNRRKAIKLEIADKISKTYLEKSFRDLKDVERTKVYSFCEWLIKTSNKTLKEFEEHFN